MTLCFSIFFGPDAVTEVKTDIYVTSFGPVSDTDMVSVIPGKVRVKDDTSDQIKCVFSPMAGPCSYVLWRSLISDEFSILTNLHLAESISCPALPTYLYKKHIPSTGVSFPSFYNTSFKINLVSYPQLNFP